MAKEKYNKKETKIKGLYISYELYNESCISFTKLLSQLNL